MTFVKRPSFTSAKEGSLEVFERGHRTHEWAVSSETCRTLRARGIWGAGYAELGVGYQVLRRDPHFPHIALCLEGNVDYFVEGQWMPAVKGTVIVAPAHAPHGARRIGRNARPGKIAWVLFDPSVKRLSHTWDHGETRLLPGRDPRPLGWALQGLYSAANAGGGQRRSTCSSLGQWADLVITTARQLVDEHDPNDGAILKAWEQVDSHLAHPWTMTELASLARLSSTHFRRRCRLVVGRSPFQHLTHLRMQRAAFLISTTRNKLVAIAAAVGYSDVFAFSVAFRRWSGQPPSQYRRPLSA